MMYALRFTAFLFALTFTASGLSAQELQVFALYDKTGEALTFAEATDRMAEADVVLFGEFHDHALIHWIQLRTAVALSEKTELAMGGEMFESDNQLLLDEYLSGLMTDKVFEDQARLWSNYKTDYKPLVEFAKANGIHFAATNVPRRYASLTAREGLDTLERLPAASKVLLPSLPIPFSEETPGYGTMMDMMSGHGARFKAENFVRAQALKDAAMAEGIMRNLIEGGTFLHFNGDFHSADYGGIYWYLKQSNPDLNVVTVKIFSESAQEFREEWKDTGDIILAVPSDFTKTH